MKPHVVVTGASSFIGSWLCTYYAENGFEVSALVHRTKKAYDGISEQRLRLMAKNSSISLFDEISSADDKMTKWISDHPGDIWVHHHHFMKDFRSQNYDLKKARLTCVDPVSAITACLVQMGYKALIYSGTYLEDEESPSPYALSKIEVWNKLQQAAFESTPLSILKISLPDVVGPYENEDRLIPQLIKHAQASATMILREPEKRGRHATLPQVLKAYLTSTQDLLKGSKAYDHLGEVLGRQVPTIELSNRDWAQFVSQYFICEKLKLPWPLREPRCEIAEVLEKKVRAEWEAFFDEYSRRKG